MNIVVAAAAADFVAIFVCYRMKTNEFNIFSYIAFNFNGEMKMPVALYTCTLAQRIAYREYIYSYNCSIYVLVQTNFDHKNNQRNAI